MSEMVLPGTYIEVRPEGLITPTRVSVNSVGVVGTAGKGPVDVPVVLSSYTEAREVFGDYDAWIDGESDELTLVRALEQIFTHGATTVWAVRISSLDIESEPDAGKATFMLSSSAPGDCVNLLAQSAGEWGNEIEVNVTDADAHSYVSGEEHNAGAITLNYTPVVESARNRITHFIDAEQRTRIMNIIYSGAAGPGQVLLEPTSGALTFAAGEEPTGDDRVTASYVVNQSASVKATLRYGTQEEVYIVANGNDLAADINDNSVLATAEPAANAAELPSTFADALTFQFFGTGSNTSGDNGAVVSAADYKAGLDLMTNRSAHIMVAAGQSHSDIGADLTAHVNTASSDLNKHERIGVVGSAADDDLDALIGHDLNSDRIVFVAPGIVTTDAATGDRVELPGSYAAAAVAGLMASFSAHISLTNKPLPVIDLVEIFTNAELTQLVQNRVLALQKKLGFKVLKGITTSTNTAWHQITTRRIVDYAKYGVRSAADPYIGLLNNERVRGALRATINSFLAEMVEDEMLISYDLDVTATREQERKGICLVTIILRPVFSIDFIKVTMFLE